VQLPAVRTINIGENRYGVLRIPRTKHEHFGFRDRIDQLRACGAAMRLGEVVIVGRVEQVTVQRVLAIGGDIHNLRAVAQLVQTRHRSRPDVLHARAGELLRYDSARILVSLGDCRKQQEKKQDSR
jgi:hypothetical protein